MNATRNPNLDALRGIAILMVLGHHLAYYELWTRAGWAGVDLFFVLSGYLISGLLFAEWQRAGSIRFSRFFIRRGFKIYPAFYALLLVSLIVQQFRPGIPSYPVNWRSVLAEATFTQSYFPGIWGQTWSLAIEEHFYLLLPFALWLMYRNSRSRDPFHRLPALFLFVATAEIAVRILVASTSSTPDLRTTYLYPTHLRLDALLFGVLLRYYREFQPAKFRELATSRSGLVIMAVALSLLAMMPNKATAMHTFGFTCVYFGAGLLLARAVDYQPHPYTAAWIVRPLALIGYYSYSIYLWHGWALRLLPHDTALSFWGCLLVSIALGIVMAKLIEYPMLALRERLVPARRHSTPSDFAYAHEETGVGA